MEAHHPLLYYYLRHQQLLMQLRQQQSSWALAYRGALLKIGYWGTVLSRMSRGQLMLMLRQ